MTQPAQAPQATLAAVRVWVAHHGSAPSRRELAAVLHVSHVTAHRYLAALELTGVIYRDERGKVRLTPPNELAACPTCGMGLEGR